jgi:Fe2+ or Zn2+ uptake regulation protein
MARLSKGEGAALLERFRRHLRDHHLPVTRQRDLIAQTVLTSDEHLSVEAIQRLLQDEGEKVGTATIYRTLTSVRSRGNRE